MSESSQYGLLAATVGRYPLKVLRSAAGYYIGTQDETGMPVSRESREYYPTYDDADQALQNRTWTQRQHP